LNDGRTRQWRCVPAAVHRPHVLNSLRQFHFSTILSPWIRRALIAGNFGTGAPNLAHEIAAVVPYRGGRKDVTEIQEITTEDIETSPSSRDFPKVYGPNNQAITAVDTPFFHFDLLGAVHAAEGGLSRSQSKISSHGSSVEK
jgi:sodium-independent sulfate anion transporter 11